MKIFEGESAAFGRFDDALEGRARVVIERLRPEIDGGLFPIKRVVGEPVEVEVDIFCDSHDLLSAVLKYRAGSGSWQEAGLALRVNDRFSGRFVPDAQGLWEYTVEAWVDRFKTWQRDFKRRIAAEQEVSVDLLIGAELVQAALGRASGEQQAALSRWLQLMSSADDDSSLSEIAESSELAALMDRFGERAFSAAGPVRTVRVDRERARFSAWYELFPRSASPTPDRHGTLRDVRARLGYVASMGFDVLYLPPIHPIGETFRKGKDNSVTAEPGDVGSPWAIGSRHGGHKSIHPELGTFEDFDELVKAAAELEIEIALDIAFQCSPDHPYVKEHPEWFRKRPDNTIQYAENPPKKYQDIYPFDFESEEWKSLWQELASVFLFWCERGVRIFRVDNPHTKSFHFWEWCLAEVKRAYPDTLFLSEAFTRPKVMYRLAKLGFTQSYTYFTWRYTKHELVEYLTELTKSEVAEFFQPNFWPNTPDILTEQLQVGGRPMFMSRLVLAATLSPSYGIYGPPYEHLWSSPREPGSEEYLGSEKYEVHYHDVDRQDSLKNFIARINKIRREEPALQTNHHLRFHPVSNDELICYSKSAPGSPEILLMVLNLDPRHKQGGTIELPLEELGLSKSHPYQLHDLLGGGRYLWHGSKNYLEVDPQIVPAHLFKLRRKLRTERDFDYYL